MEFSGGPARDAENSKTDSRAYDFQGGLNTKARGHKGPTEAPSGRPKGPRDIEKMGSGNRQPQKVCFSSGNTTFIKKTPKRSRGGPWVSFSRKFGAPGGPRAPPGDF